MTVNLEVRNNEAMVEHRKQCKAAEDQLERFVQEFKERELEAMDRFGTKRPDPSGKFAPRKINEAAYQYIGFQTAVTRANNDLLSSVINDLQDAMDKVDLEAVERSMKAVRGYAEDVMNDNTRQIADMNTGVKKAKAMAQEALELLKDAHARLDDHDELLEDYFE